MGWTLEMSAEVHKWIMRLSVPERASVYAAIDRLKDQGNTLRLPWSKPLGKGLMELRFDYGGKAGRITYTIDPDKLIITLTAFRKQRQVERREIARARRALAEHRQSRRQ